ncbi:MAG: putative glycoside hydrolase [Patescibacteria group bacterium]
MRLTLYSIFGLAAFYGIFILFRPLEVSIAPAGAGPAASSSSSVPVAAEKSSSTTKQATDTPKPTSGDAALQPQLKNPPEIAKAIYISAWSAGTPSRIKSLVDLVKRTELNAVVVDVKDYSGYVSYVTDVREVREAKSDREPRIARPNELIKMLHDNGIYVIARVTVFQDSIFAKAHPEWALKNKATGKLWVDRKQLAWMDPAGKPTWDYHVAIAKDALARGFDEVNFDYIRFPSDGKLSEASYPFWDEKTPRSKIIRQFFVYLREQLPGARISADLFGLATVNRDDLGIGQIIEDAYRNFDYVYPMVYPSHYAPGFIGYTNPGQYPYEVMKYSLDRARERRDILIRGTSSTPGIPQGKVGKLRPWIQDFDLGATYTAGMIKKEFQATYDSLNMASSSDAYGGWAIWDPANTYTESALLAE